MTNPLMAAAIFTVVVNFMALIATVFFSALLVLCLHILSNVT